MPGVGPVQQLPGELRRVVGGEDADGDPLVAERPRLSVVGVPGQHLLRGPDRLPGGAGQQPGGQSGTGQQEGEAPPAQRPVSSVLIHGGVSSVMTAPLFGSSTPCGVHVP